MKPEIMIGSTVKVKAGSIWQEHDWGGKVCKVSEIKHSTDITVYVVWHNQGRGVFYSSELELMSK